MTKWYFMQMLKNLSGKRKWLKCTTVYCEVCCDLFHLLLLPRLQAVHSYSQYSNIHCIFLVSVEVLKMHIPPCLECYHKVCCSFLHFTPNCNWNEDCRRVMVCCIEGGEREREL